jgi:asparagine synthase (glutamine-hydrolysing)
LCGIAGFTHLRSPSDAAIVRRAVQAIVHRGPDQQDVYCSPHISLGAVRLKIIDLASGDQPIRSEDGRTVIVFNGEIYNFRELREELQARGRRFHSACDTEVVLQAFLEWDTACFAKLRGMFAVALWNEDALRLVLARDRMGIKPLYLTTHGGDLFFGSELKALFAHPQVERRTDEQGLARYLTCNFVPGSHTLIEGIHKLEPGTWLEWRSGRARTEKYWQLELRPDHTLRFEDAKAELDRLLRESVREHLVSDVPLGVWLSGGLDSSTILHYAAQVSSQQLNTFSIGFPGRSFDESMYYRAVAQEYGTNHREFELTPESGAAETVEQLATYCDEPSADAGALPLWHLSRISKRHVTVTLSGEGADELFGGYVTYHADRLSSWLRLLPLPLRRAAASAAAWWPVSDEKISFEYKLKRFLDGATMSPDEAHVFWNGTFSSAQRLRLLSRDSGFRVEQLFRSLPPSSRSLGYLNRYLWADQLYYLNDDILTKVDRVSMAHSLEVRPPFLDHRIVEFAARLPESWKLRGATLKFIVRDLMRERLPQMVIRRPKEGFDIPVHEWFRGCLRQLLLDTLTERAVRETGLFHWPEVHLLIQRHFSRRVNAGYHLWGLVLLFLWMKRWGVRMEPSTRQEASLAGSSAITS